MSQTNGIATLLKTEKEAHEIVANSRQFRQERLKQAKIDAAKEISEYKLLKDKELKTFEANNLGNVEELEAKDESMIQKELDEIRRIGKERTNDVVKLLIDAVTNPTSEIHINAT